MTTVGCAIGPREQDQGLYIFDPTSDIVDAMVIECDLVACRGKATKRIICPAVQVVLVRCDEHLYIDLPCAEFFVAPMRPTLAEDVLNP